MKHHSFVVQNLSIQSVMKRRVKSFGQIILKKCCETCIFVVICMRLNCIPHERNNFFFLFCIGALISLSMFYPTSALNSVSNL